MILLVAMLVSVAVAWALGAKLTRLADVQFRGDVLVFGALAVQLVIFTPLATRVPEAVVTPLHVGTYLMILAFLALNLRRSGFWLVGFGVAANVIVIFANGGHMPVSIDAWVATGADPSTITDDGGYNNNVLAGPGTHVAWLGDIFALPASVPLANALSIGDVLIIIGMAAFVYRACTPRLETPAAGLLAPLRHPEFRRVLVGRTTSKLGDWLTMTAVVTWVYGETRSTAAVSAFLVARIAAGTLGGIVSAPLLDRISGFRALSLVEGLRGAVTAAMIPFAVAGHVVPVVALACVSALLGSATNPSAASLVPEILPRPMLQAGNALHGVARNVMMVLGAALGGISVAQLGIGTALALDLVTFLAAAVIYRAFAGLRASVAEPVAPSGATRGEIVATLLRNRIALGLTASFTVVTAGMGLMNATLPRFFDSRLGDPNAYGPAIAAIGAGLLCGELLTGFVRRETFARRSIALAFAAMAAAVAVMLQAEVTATAYLMLFLLGAADGTTEVVYDTLVQLHVPRRVRAGCFAIASSVASVGMVAGMGAAPLLAMTGSTSLALEVAAGLCAAGAVIAGLALVRGPKPVSEVLDGEGGGNAVLLHRHGGRRSAAATPARRAV